MNLMTQAEIDKSINDIISNSTPEEFERINLFFARCDKKFEERKKSPDYVKPTWSIEEMLQMCLNDIEELSL